MESQEVATKELSTKLIQLIASRLKIDEKTITPASRFQEDLGADSLDIVELLMAIEDAFGVSIPEEESEKLKTVGDAINFITSKG